MSKQQLNGTSAQENSQENAQTEPHIAGFATGEQIAESDDSSLPVQTAEPVEQDTSSLPQTKAECFGHEIWVKSKRCVVCDTPQFGPESAVRVNLPLFNHFGCAFIRTCENHRLMVSDHFAKPEFSGPYNGPETRYCPECRQPFTVESDTQTAFCGKECQGNWLDRIPC